MSPPVPPDPGGPWSGTPSGSYRIPADLGESLRGYIESNQRLAMALESKAPAKVAVWKIAAIVLGSLGVMATVGMIKVAYTQLGRDITAGLAPTSALTKVESDAKESMANLEKTNETAHAAIKEDLGGLKTEMESLHTSQIAIDARTAALYEVIVRSEPPRAVDAKRKAKAMRQP